MNPRSELERRIGQRDKVRYIISAKKARLKSLKRKAKRLEEARHILETVAKATQQELEFRICEPVSLALAATFADSYKLGISFETRRSQTEADIYFTKTDNENRIHPLSASGGGVCDVSSLALRLSLWFLMEKKTRPIFILDEPFRNINDPSRSLHQSAAKMLREVCDKFRVQIILITLCPEIISVADKVFQVNKKNKISKVKELSDG